MSAAGKIQMLLCVTIMFVILAPVFSAMQGTGAIWLMIFEIVGAVALFCVICAGVWVGYRYLPDIMDKFLGIVLAFVIGMLIVPQAVADVLAEGSAFNDTPPTLTSFVQEQYVTNDMHINDYESLLEYYWPYIAHEQGWVMGYAQTPLPTPGNSVDWSKGSIKHTIERETYKS